MKYNLTEEQLLIYVYGEKKARNIIENNLSNHYRDSFQKLQNNQKFVWNWTAFFFGPFWFVYQNLPMAFFAFFIIESILCLSLIDSGLGVYSFTAFLATILLFIGALSDRILIKTLSKKLKKGYFNDLSEETRLQFIKKVGVTEEQYLTFIYDQEKAQNLIKHNVPNHYRKAFKNFAIGKKSFNLAAGGFGIYWLLYRNLSYVAIIAGIFYFFIEVTNCFFYNFSSNNIGSVGSVFAIFGDSLILNHISKQIREGNFKYLVNTRNNVVIFASIISFFIITLIIVSLDSNETQENLFFENILIILNILIPLIIIPGISILHTKYKIRKLKKDF
jgi:hypothetical protein